MTELGPTSGVTGRALSVLAGSRVLRSLDVSGSSATAEFLTTVVPTLAELLLLDVSGTRFAFEQAEVMLPPLRKLKEFFCCATKLDEGRQSSLRLLGGGNFGIVLDYLTRGFRPEVTREPCSTSPPCPLDS